MLHEIYPKEYKVSYSAQAPEPEDPVLLFDGEKVCCRIEAGEAAVPRLSELPGAGADNLRYLFSIDGEHFFMPAPRARATAPFSCPEGYQWQDYSVFRTTGPRYLAFAVVTAQELYQWYSDRKFCGRCGAETVHSGTERACICPVCGAVEYPKISPVVIVAVTHGEDLLVTKYKDRPYRRYALVAGFAEIGESLEDTVRREVMEETGVSVRNIRYYKSQPWGFTSTLLSGFFCELDGDPEIHVDGYELSEAIWLSRDNIPASDLDIALTAEMMEEFRTGRA